MPAHSLELRRAVRPLRLGQANNSMWYPTHMGAKAVQVSLNADFLRRIDNAPETKKLGRSGFIRVVIEEYFRERSRRQIDEQIRRAFASHEAKAQLTREVDEWAGAQAWPDD